MTECFTTPPPLPPRTILSAYPIERGRGGKREREEGWEEEGEKLKAERLFAELHKIGRKDCRALTLTLSLALSLWAVLMLCRAFSTVCVQY